MTASTPYVRDQDVLRNRLRVGWERGATAFTGLQQKEELPREILHRSKKFLPRPGQRSSKMCLSEVLENRLVASSLWQVLRPQFLNIHLVECNSRSGPMPRANHDQAFVRSLSQQ